MKHELALVPILIALAACGGKARPADPGATPAPAPAAQQTAGPLTVTGFPMKGNSLASTGVEAFRESGAGPTYEVGLPVKVDPALPLALVIDPSALSSGVKQVTWAHSVQSPDGSPIRTVTAAVAALKDPDSSRWFVPFSVLFPKADEISRHDLQLVDLELVLDGGTKRDLELTFHAVGPAPTLSWSADRIDSVAVAEPRALAKALESPWTFRRDRVSNPSGRALTLWMRMTQDGDIRLIQDFLTATPALDSYYSVPYNKLEHRRAQPLLKLAGILIEENGVQSQVGNWQSVQLEPGQTATIDSRLMMGDAGSATLGPVSIFFYYATCEGSLVPNSVGTQDCNGDKLLHSGMQTGSVAETGARVEGNYVLQTLVTDPRDSLLSTDSTISSGVQAISVTAGAPLPSDGWSWLDDPYKLYVTP
jgi:hypothetical protein